MTKVESLQLKILGWSRTKYLYHIRVEGDSLHQYFTNPDNEKNGHINDLGNSRRNQKGKNRDGTKSF